MTSVTSRPTIYPVYCHDLSPTIGKWCPLRAVDVHKLQSVGMVLDGKPLYHYGNHPIKWVRVTGVIVAIDDFYQRRVYTVDDSSGQCIECMCEITPPPPPSTLSMPANINQSIDKQKAKASKPEPTVTHNASGVTKSKVAEGIDLGSVAKVKGRVCEFRGMKQIEISSVVLMRGTEEEVRCWNEILDFRRDILSKPWVVEPAKEERMRKRSMGKKTSKRKADDAMDQDKTRKVGEVKDKGKGRQSWETRTSIDGPLEPPERKKRGHEVQRFSEEEKRLLAGSKKQKDKDGAGLKSENKANYPSIAVRRKVAGKYDALGI